MKNNVVDLVAARAKRDLETGTGSVESENRIVRILQAIDRINKLMRKLKGPKI